MYRAQPWTMRQIAGFGTADDTNGRFRYLIAQGQTGISTDFDMPTLMGYDSDDPRSDGEVGREGVAIDSVDDMLDLFRDIDLEKISVSMTINPTAFILLAMYLVLADERGFDRAKLSGTTQNDIIKEYIAQKSGSIRRARRCASSRHDRLRRKAPFALQSRQRQRLPHPRSGQHRDPRGRVHPGGGIAYVEEVLKTGIDADEFAPRLSFYFVSQIDFLEEVAKFRAARRIWARVMKERFGAKKAESMRLRFHCRRPVHRAPRASR